MSRTEFEALSADGYGNILVQLATDSLEAPSMRRGEGRRQKIVNLDVFRTFNVPKHIVNVIRACARANREGRLWEPVDAIERTAVSGGALREHADTLGGFVGVDRALAETKRRVSRQDLARAMREDRGAMRPCEDLAALFDWRIGLVL